MVVDVHQHIWTPELVTALGCRSATPRLRPGADGEAWLDLPGEAPSLLVDVPEDAQARAAQLGEDGAARGLVALSSALGAERLPLAEAEDLLGAYDAGVRGLPCVYGSWGSVALRDPDPGRIDALLDAGHVGLCLPADALATPAAVAALTSLLERLQERDAPLFVHPVAHGAADGAPAWWPALTGYVASLGAAWHAWAVAGRPALPRLRVLFAALAGLAPLHAERLTARGGPAGAAQDPLTFYDTSSYGPVAIAAVRGVVGPRALVHGSDRPYAAPPPSTEQESTVNAARLLTGHPQEHA